MTPTVLDHELYEAWLETHADLPQHLRRLSDVVPRQILGGGERVYDADSGVCLAIVYRNPDLEGQQETARFWEEVRHRLERKEDT